ncbi:hypothetical protein [Halobacillus sp. A5]|uniref:hypothetical protein n=1 Tax=Halobacillus sp. A5 TaxID=2880263 RepID=UPI0020A67296|nr:hypothetical protein [Halobacillus sp. A5]MCP3029665.1 hypothetical protein [Halobacillus sp. A5]
MKLLTDKQRQVLEGINRFGVITSTQLIHYLEGQVSSVSIYSTKKVLVNLGFIAEEKIGYHRLLYVRPRGVHFLGSELTPFSRVNYKQLEHQLSMNDCLLSYKNAAELRGISFEFMTERELRSQYIHDNFSSSDRKDAQKINKVADRIPDGIVFENVKKIALEVELTQKASKRYIHKLARYKDEILNGQYDMVRYVCESKKIQNTVGKYAKEEGFTSSMLQLHLREGVVEHAKQK